MRLPLLSLRLPMAQFYGTGAMAKSNEPSATVAVRYFWHAQVRLQCSKGCSLNVVFFLGDAGTHTREGCPIGLSLTQRMHELHIAPLFGSNESTAHLDTAGAVKVTLVAESGNQRLEQACQ